MLQWATITVSRGRRKVSVNKALWTQRSSDLSAASHQTGFQSSTQEVGATGPG